MIDTDSSGLTRPDESERAFGGGRDGRDLRLVNSGSEPPRPAKRVQSGSSHMHIRHLGTTTPRPHSGLTASSHAPSASCHSSRIHKYTLSYYTRMPALTQRRVKHTVCPVTLHICTCTVDVPQVSPSTLAADFCARRPCSVCDMGHSWHMSPAANHSINPRFIPVIVISRPAAETGLFQYDV